MILKSLISINNMFVNIYKIMESHNDNYIYIYIVTNQQNIYLRNMKIQLNQFYFKYNHSGYHIQSIFIKKVEINNYGKINIDDTYISPFE